jgi:hypothetical protein
LTVDSAVSVPAWAHNAELGFLQLVVALLDGASGDGVGRRVQVQLGTLTISATKGEGAARKWVRDNNAGRIQIPPASIERRRLLAAEHLGRCIGLEYQLQLITGEDWFVGIVGILEPGLREMWPHRSP